MAKLWMRLEKLKKYIHVICNALELIAAGLMLVGVVLLLATLYLYNARFADRKKQ